MFKRAYLPAVLVAGSLHTAAAQDRATTLEPGARVRITAPNLGLEKQQGTFQAFRGDTLVMMADSSLFFPVGSITQFDVHRGQKAHTWAGLGIGFLAGAGLGTLFGATYDCEKVLGSSDEQALCTGTGAALGAASGLLLGGLIGAFVWKSDRWEEVPLDQIRVSLVPRRGGFALGVSVAF